jgi:hypothetical protein
MKNFLIGFIILAIVTLCSLLVVNEVNRLGRLDDVYYFGTMTNENSFIDNLINDNVIYTFTSIDGEIYTLSFTNDMLEEDTQYKLEYKAMTILQTYRRSHYPNFKKINGDWYSLENITLVPVEDVEVEVV